MRLADALGVTTEEFFRTEDLPEDRLASLRERVELLEAFERIEDRQARRRCLSYVRLAADRGGSR